MQETNSPSCNTKQSNRMIAQMVIYDKCIVVYINIRQLDFTNTSKLKSAAIIWLGAHRWMGYYLIIHLKRAKTMLYTICFTNVSVRLLFGIFWGGTNI